MHARPNDLRIPSARRRGAAYSLMVMVATMTLFTLGSALVAPSQMSLRHGNVILFNLTSQTLAEAGLEWARDHALQGGRETHRHLTLESGVVDVSVTSQGEQLQVIAVGCPKRRFETSSDIVLQATLALRDGRWSLSSIQQRLSLRTAAPVAPPKAPQ